MKKLKKGDDVIVIAGKDKGKRGAILALVDKGKKVLVSGVNIAKKHTRGNPNAGVQGGIISKEMPLDRSNVMAFDPTKKKGSRVGIRTLKDGQQVRFYKSSDQVLEDAKE
jgi:large subunit ribosomal protein L24